MSPVSLSILRPILAISLVLAAAAPRAQGSLTPPAGAPAPVMKTLDQVEPRVSVQSLGGKANEAQYLIDKPGSYYLTAGIHGVAGLYAIEVTSGPVTLDLNGFTIWGAPGTTIGIQSVAQQTTIRNGCVRDWGSTGINASSDCFIENITAAKNGSIGIYVQSDATIRNCHASQSLIGIDTNGAAVIEDCEAFSNSIAGIQLGGGGRVERCYSHSNSGSGIAASSYTHIVNNNASGNTLSGISVNADAQVAFNEVNNNGSGGTGMTAAGIALYSSYNDVEHNHLAENKIGIKTSSNLDSNAVIANVAIHSSSSNYSGLSATAAGPVVTTTASQTNPFANLSLP